MVLEDGHQITSYRLAKECHAVLYLQHLGKTKASKAAIEEAVNALAWAHSLSGLPSPAANPFVQVVLDGLRRTYAKPVRKKEPFTVEMLTAIVNDAMANDTLRDT